MESELAKFTAVESRLREVIRGLVKRRAAHGTPLSWRLMFEIEDEAMRLLCDDPELDASYIRMMTVPSAPLHLRTEESVGLQDIYAMRTALWMIQEAYYHSH